jgi:hypothetical protein
VLGSDFLVRGAQVESHWLADGQLFWYYADNGDSGEFYLVAPGANTKERDFDGARLRAALRIFVR